MVGRARDGDGACVFDGNDPEIGHGGLPGVNDEQVERLRDRKKSVGRIHKRHGHNAWHGDRNGRVVFTKRGYTELFKLL